MDLAKLQSDLERAHKLACRRIIGVPDAGSCNSDALGILFDRKPHPSTRAKIEATVNAVEGLSGYWSESYRKPILRIMKVGLGQGCRNTMAAEAMAEVMKSAGWRACVDYRID